MKTIVSGCCLALGASLAFAESSFEPGLEASAHAVYDSAVGIDEVDQNSREGDSGKQWALRPSLAWASDAPLTLEAAYSYSALRYDTLRDYDTDIGDLSLSATYKSRAGDWRYRIDEVQADVAQADFMSMTLHSAGWGRLFAESRYLRVGLSHQDKRFDTLESRDATGLGLMTQGFWFFNAFQSHVFASVAVEDERAVSAAYSNRAWQAQTGLSHKGAAWNKETRWRLSLQYRSATYEPVTRSAEPYDAADDWLTAADPQVSVFTRQDTLVKARLNVEQSLLQGLFASMEAEYNNQVSNEPSADFDRYLVRLGLGYDF